jgi:hypothetical protein
VARKKRKTRANAYHMERAGVYICLNTYCRSVDPRWPAPPNGSINSSAVSSLSFSHERPEGPKGGHSKRGDTDDAFFFGRRCSLSHRQERFLLPSLVASGAVALFLNWSIASRDGCVDVDSFSPTPACTKHVLMSLQQTGSNQAVFFC